MIASIESSVTKYVSTEGLCERDMMFFVSLFGRFVVALADGGSKARAAGHRKYLQLSE